jgi:hypothetical protein
MKVQPKSTPKGTIEIRSLDGSVFRCAVVMDGVVRFVGSVEKCKERAEMLAPRAADRDRQDRMLRRVVG